MVVAANPPTMAILAIVNAAAVNLSFMSYPSKCGRRPSMGIRQAAMGSPLAGRGRRGYAMNHDAISLAGRRIFPFKACSNSGKGMKTGGK